MTYLTAYFTPSGPEVAQRYLHFYQGFLKLVPSLCGKLDTMLSKQLSKICRAVHMYAGYVHYIIDAMINRLRKA